MAETIVDDGGKLANVFVYVKDGLGDRTFDVPKDSVTIDQKGCKYHPHVFGVMAGQNIKIKNDDQTTHNIHPTPARQSRVERIAAACRRSAREEFRPRRNHAAGEVQPASLDEDVRQCGEEPVLRGHGAGWQIRNQGTSAGRLHHGVRAGETWDEQTQKVTLAAKDSKTVDQRSKRSSEL